MMPRALVSSLSECALDGLLPGTGTPDTGEWCFFNCFFFFYITDVSRGQIAAAWLNPHCSNAPLCFIQGTCTTSFASDLIFFFSFYHKQIDSHALAHAICIQYTLPPRLTPHSNFTNSFYCWALRAGGLKKRNPALTDYWCSHFLNKKKKKNRPCLVLTSPPPPPGVSRRWNQPCTSCCAD